MKPMWPSHWIPPGTVAIPREARDVVAYVARQVDCTPDDLTGPSRAGVLVRSRAVVCGVLRQRGLSLPTIGRALGNRHHQTVMHALKNLPRYYAERPRIEELYERTYLYSMGERV